MHDEQFQPDPVAVVILRASMLHVPFDGWGEAALIAGAVDLGYDAVAVHTAFPRGAIDAISLHSRLADQSMVDAFLSLPERLEKVHLRIRALVLLRLEIAQPHKDAVRRALSLLAMPANAKLSAKLLYETVDSMWRVAGQRDTSFSFYTKRGSLAMVYSSTVLAWLADNSGNLDGTVDFLDRRLADIARIPKITKPLRSVISASERIANSLMQGLAKRHSR
jgi:ubiquinone biosynthesis protein COQ9